MRPRFTWKNVLPAIVSASAAPAHGTVEGGIEIVGALEREDLQVDAEGKRRPLHLRASKLISGGVRHVTKDGQPRERRQRLAEQIQALAVQCHVQIRDAGHIAARPTQTLDQPERDGVVPDAQHHDRDGAGRVSSGRDRRFRVGEQHVDREVDELGGQVCQSVDPPLGVANVEHVLLAFDVAEGAKRIAERDEVGPRDGF